jgi:hypothetical protein
MEYQRELQQKAELRKGIGTPRIDFYPESDGIDTRSENVKVLKTKTRTLKSIAYGSILAHQTIQHDGSSTCAPQLSFHRRGKSPFCMDMIFHVGYERFIVGRRREEIQRGVSECFGFPVSTGTISNMSLEFLVRLEYIHQNQTEAMLAEIQKNYGYVLIVDGTGDGDSERIVLCLDGTSALRERRKCGKDTPEGSIHIWRSFSVHL